MNQEEKQKAYNYAVYILSLSLRTTGELREKMRLKKYNVDVIDVVIDELAQNKYLDDQRYAEVYLDNLKKYKNFGFYGIKKKFMQKRLPASIIEQVLSEGLTASEELKIAERFLRKQKSEDKNKKARQLASRGFRSDVISKIIF